MKKNLKILVFLLLAVFLLAGNSFSLDFGTNITGPDGSSDGTSWHGTDEDNEVEPGMDGKQVWDLEGFFLKGTTLTMVGGFDFWDGVSGYRGASGSELDFRSGDIFIDTDGITTPLSPDYGTTNGQIEIAGNLGYEYVIDMDWQNERYDVISLTDDATLRSVHYRMNNLSNPWLYLDGGTVISDDYNDVDFTGGEYSYDFEGLTGGNHYAVSVDLSFLGDNQDFIAHFTMGCGNDNLMGSGTTPVPEPATMLLFGSGLVIIAGLGRKRFLK